ncbi:hypothetical protein OBBRIDRAFT_808754, partial [Obba rivulosa]
MATINYPNIDPVLLWDEPHMAHAIEPSAQIGEIGPQRVSKGTRRAHIEEGLTFCRLMGWHCHLSVVANVYATKKVHKLKDALRSRKLPISGRWADLIARLEASDQALASEHAGPGALSLAMAVQTPPLASYPRVCRHVVHPFLLVLGPTCCMSHSATDCKEEEEDEGVVELAVLDKSMAIDSLTNGAVSHWAYHALAKGQIPDVIINTDHIILYLQFAATRKLLLSRGKEHNSNKCLSASSLKKIMTMLGHMQSRQVTADPLLEQTRSWASAHITEFYKALMIQAQRLQLEDESFDVTSNTILDSQLFPEHFEEVKHEIFSSVKQLPSMIKAHFCWTWQCTTLNRGDELVNLLLCCVQPFEIALSDFLSADGRRGGLSRQHFGVLSMYHETKVPKPGKQEPDYNFVLPNHDPLRCPVGALALQLHYIFDQEQLVQKVPEWNWSSATTWRTVKLVFGKTVGKSYDNQVLEEDSPCVTNNAYVPGRYGDEVDGIGHWTGNTQWQ